MYTLRRQKGFTLIETLVAITILITAIVGPMTIAARGLQSAYFAKEELTAVYLAQEGIELVREKRDDYALSHRNGGTYPGPDDWLEGPGNEMSACATNPAVSGCGLDSLGAVRDCAVANACNLNYNSGTQGMFSHVGGSPTPYKRVIQIGGTVSEQVITVTVTWQANLFSGSPKTITLQTRLFDQYNMYD